MAYGAREIGTKIVCSYKTKAAIVSVTKLADNNPTSNNTCIEKFISDNSNSYEAVAKSKNYNFFQIDNYDELVKIHGKEFMQNINMNFIRMKYKAGNTSYSTTTPFIIQKGDFKLELDLLKELGGEWSYVGRNLWKLIR